jgi:hypothetical protein
MLERVIRALARPFCGALAACYEPMKGADELGPQP